MAVAMKYERQGFLRTATVPADTWTRMGEGFTDLTDSRNPVVDETAYIDDMNATKTITSYAPEWAIEFDVIKDNDVIDFVRDIGENLRTGANAETEYIEFDLWDIDPDTLEVPCKKYAVAVQVDSIGGGAGGEKLTGSGVLLGKGDPTSGYFDTVSNTFSTTPSS